jgi:hypothetical protein
MNLNLKKLGNEGIWKDEKNGMKPKRNAILSYFEETLKLGHPATLRPMKFIRGYLMLPLTEP